MINLEKSIKVKTTSKKIQFLKLMNNINKDIKEL